MLFSLYGLFIDLRFNLASSLGVISLTLTGEADLTRKEMVSSPGFVHTGWRCAGENKKLECWAATQLNLLRNGAEVFVPLCSWGPNWASLQWAPPVCVL